LLAVCLLLSLSPWLYIIRNTEGSQDFGGAHLGWLQKAAPADLQRASKDVDAKIAAVEERLSARLLKLEQLATKLPPLPPDDRVAQVPKSTSSAGASPAAAAAAPAAAAAAAAPGTGKGNAIVTALTKINNDYIALALVLQESVLAHAGPYDFSFVAIVMANAADKDLVGLTDRGWTILRADIPVPTKEIVGPLKSVIDKSGCCGPSELIKLHLFRMTEYERVLFFDSDAIVMGDLGELVRSSETLYTIDDGLGGGCINGGFLATTPVKETYTAMVATVRKGDFNTAGGAWGNTGTGWCYGGQTFQGVVPYYFKYVKKSAFRALNASIYNNMGKWCPKPGHDVPHKGSVSHVRSAHFTWCQKPFACAISGTDFCRALHAAFWRDFNRALDKDKKNPSLVELQRKHKACR
jgi:hypothetical protein